MLAFLSCTEEDNPSDSDDDEIITWAKTFGGETADMARGLCITADGGYAIIGGTASVGGGDINLLKLNSRGALVWSETYGGSSNDEGFAVIEADEGGFYVGGNYNVSTTSQYIYFLKVDGRGEILLDENIGEDTLVQLGNSMMADPNGGFVIAGAVSSGLPGSYGDIYLAKIDNIGNLIWHKEFGDFGFDRGSAIIPAANNEYIAVGEFEYTFLHPGTFVAKLDDTGKVMWDDIWQGERTNGADWITATGGGYFVICGDEYFSTGNSDILLTMIDGDGVIWWQRTIGGLARDWSECVITTSDGGFAVAGSTESFGSGGWDVYLVKTDSYGNVEWQRTFGGSGNDFGYALAQTADGGFVICGSTESYGSGATDMYVIKTDSDGRIR